jgi:hypothetical protein
LSDAARLDELRAAARYAAQRRDLYVAKSYGPRPTSPARLRELERAADQARERLEAAEAEARRPPPQR